MVKKIISPTLIVFILFVSVTFYPFLVIFGGKVPIDIEIEPAFISGLITLSGVLVGFVTAIVATKQPLPSWVTVMLLMNWALLLITATEVFTCALGLSPSIYAMTCTMCSLISNHFTAGAILILRLFSK
jgi:hypothetical protein